MSLPLEIFHQSAESAKHPDSAISVSATQAEILADDSESIWKKELANATTSVAVLLKRLELSHHIKMTEISTIHYCGKFYH